MNEATKAKFYAYGAAADMVGAVLENALDHFELGTLDASNLIDDIAFLNAELIRLSIECLDSEDSRERLLAELHEVKNIGRL